jgi:hypothetical protein
MRENVRKCFRAFVNEIDSSSLETLTNVVTRKNEEYLKDMEEEDEEEDQM